MKKYTFVQLLLFLQYTINQGITEGILLADADSLDVDAFINSYISEVERTLRLDSRREHTIGKRSIADVDITQIEGIDVLSGFEEVFSLPAKFPNDIVLFSKCAPGGHSEQAWFAVALEASLTNPQWSLANELVLYRYHAGVWTSKYRIKVVQGIRLAVDQIGDDVFIIVAEHHADDTRGSTVLQVDTDTNSLHFVHRLATHYPSHIIMWKWADMEAFAAVAIAENGPGHERRYSTQSPVYQWRGSHFDMIGSLPTHNPQALAHFNIRNSMFIAVANFQNDLGDTNVDSDIFRYNLSTNKFSLYQKLPTEAAVDIKYFCFEGPHITEGFLIYASAYHTDEEGNKDYNTASIIYKLSDEEYFVPFQALHVTKISSWLSVRYVKDQRENLFLMGVTEEGVVSYQYDGWRFAPAGALVDQTSFGPGPRVLTVFYSGEQTLISVANKLNPGSATSVFSPVLRKVVRVDDVKKTLSLWEKLVSEEASTLLTKIASLTQKAQMAPKVNDPTLEMSRVVFSNVSAHWVETAETKGLSEIEEITAINELSSMTDDLRNLHVQLEGVKNKINEISLNTRNVYEDTTEPEANIKCTHSCVVHDLEIEQVNGEDFNEFLTNAVPISDTIEFDSEVSFKQLALMDPLETKIINGHAVEKLVDWSKSVHLGRGLKVEGDFIVEDDLNFDHSRIESVDDEIDELDTSSTNVVTQNIHLKTLHVGKLVLEDGQLSGVDFDDFSKQSLKTEGDQVFTEFKDIQRIEADSVDASKGLLKAGQHVSPSPFHNQQVKKVESPNDQIYEATYANMMRAKSAEKKGEIESNNLLDDTIIIHDNFEILGTVTIENGSLTVSDLLDLKKNISAAEIKTYGIPLNETVMDQHFEFNVSFKTPQLTVDTVNGVKLEDLADSVTMKDMVDAKQAETTEGMEVDNKTSPEKNEHLAIDSLTVESVNSQNVKLGDRDWSDIVLLDDNGELIIGKLVVNGNAEIDSIHVRGNVNNFHLEKLLSDTVYDDGKAYTVIGSKNFENGLTSSNLILGDGASSIDEIIWRKRLSQANVVKVKNLFYTGRLDGVEANEFGEWLLTEGDQTLCGAMTMESVTAERLRAAPNDQFNLVNLHRLASEGVFLDDNVTLNSIVFDAPVTANKLEVGGKINELKVPEDIVLLESPTEQQISGHKIVKGNLNVLGRFKSTLIYECNITAMCGAVSSNSTSIMVLGNASFSTEPNILKSVNNKNLTDLLKNTWFKEDNVKVTQPIYFEQAHFKSLDVELINNVYVEDALSQLVSLSEDQMVNGTFYFRDVIIQNDLEGKEAIVGDRVQGIHLLSFLKNVLLDGEDQEIWGEPSFGQLIVDGVLESKGFVNGLNFSQDVLLLLPNNGSIQTVESLKVGQLSVEKLHIPNGTLVSGVDVELWNKTAVKKSGKNIVNGNLLINGDFSSANGISVQSLINDIKFDKEHIMLIKGNQKFTGSKNFSEGAVVKIKKLHVYGLLNGMNITDFYIQQVPTSGKVSLTGKNNFSSPIRASRAKLPEIYQGYNLTWLEEKLRSRLPTKQYKKQLATLRDLQEMARTSLDGKVLYGYAQNWTLRSEIKGPIVSLFPLKSENATVLAKIISVENATQLSLLHWNDENKSFKKIPGMRLITLKGIPSHVQTVKMQGAEISAYITRFDRHSAPNSAGGYGELLSLNDGGSVRSKTIPFGRPGTILLSFRNQTRTCFVLVAKTCRLFCDTLTGKRRKMPSFSCHNVTEATLLVTEKTVYLLALEVGDDKNLVVWKLLGRQFTKILSRSQFNAIDIAATVANEPYVAVATRHNVGSPRPETVDIYRFDVQNENLSLEQSLDVISPKKIIFSVLPSNESALYVASDNPATPLWIYLHRGVLGYQLVAVDRTLPTLKDMHAFTNENQRHFVTVVADEKCIVLEANFG